MNIATTMYNMNKHFTRTLLAIAALAAGLASCDKDVYDKDRYIELTKLMQPTDSIDAAHNWKLTTNYVVTVDARNVHIGTESVVILSANPAAGENAEVLARHDLSDGQAMYVGFTAPTTSTVFYAALVDTAGTYTIDRFTPTQREVNFAAPVASRVTVGDRQLSLQSFSYCFEGSIPEPTDYDYNDLVLRVSQERTAYNQIKLNVTLVAVGTQQKIAAGIRLTDYNYNDIASIVAVDGDSFDKNYKGKSYNKVDPKMMESDSLLVKGFGGEAILNLFEDAHWATGEASMLVVGMLERLYYNVSKSTNETSDIISPRTISYVITFKDGSLLNYFSLASIDPFIITSYNGAFWETHAVYEHQEDQLLHNYNFNSEAKILPWALTIPNNGFRYPLEGVTIGYYKNGALFGAYMTVKHAFGEWAANEEQANDWYNYPTSNQVF